MTITVRYAEGDQDVAAIHQFLCLVGGPTLPGPINPIKSMIEVRRVVQQDCALMAFKNGELVGTLGLIRPEAWWGDLHFLANRWFFTLPRLRAGKPLLKEAIAIAKASDLELQIYDETKGRLVIFNKSKNRRRPLVFRQHDHPANSERQPGNDRDVEPHRYH
jgi:hypothetical protein